MALTGISNVLHFFVTNTFNYFQFRPQFKIGKNKEIIVSILFMCTTRITVLVGWNGKWRFSPGMLGIWNSISLSKHFLCNDDCECRPFKSTFLIACIRFLVTRANSRAKLFYRLVFLDQTEHFWPGDSLVSLFSKSIRERNNISLVSRQVFCKTISETVP